MENLIIVLLVLIGIFLLCRELMCWYWKINEMVTTLKQIDLKLAIIVSEYKIYEDGSVKHRVTAGEKSENSGDTND